MMALLAVEIGRDVYKAMHPPQPAFFPWDGRAAPQAVVPLNLPIVDDTELLQWSVRAVLATYSINYHDYAVQLNSAGRNYTPNGWNTFAKVFEHTGNLAAIKEGRMLCFTEVQRAAVIRQTKVIAGNRLAYDVQFPIEQTCQNWLRESKTSLMITALIVRTDTEQHADGLAIEQLVADQR